MTAHFTAFRRSGSFVRRSLRLMALLIGAAACSAGPPPAGAPPVRAAPSSVFQGYLDQLDVPYRPPTRGKAILVNVPAFELIAFEDANPVFRSRIIVGNPRNPTPLIETYATAVRFRPRWRPTPDMVASGEYKDRIWPPGSNNPLGLAAIRLEPGLLVYLHDTNRRTLFEREDRALSHGCIRVQRWDELISWLLDLDLAEVHRLANGRKTFDMPTPPVPVKLGYFTTFPDDAGRAVRYEDVYRLRVAAGPEAPVCVAAGTDEAPPLAAPG